MDMLPEFPKAGVAFPVNEFAPAGSGFVLFKAPRVKGAPAAENGVVNAPNAVAAFGVWNAAPNILMYLAVKPDDYRNYETRPGTKAT